MTLTEFLLERLAEDERHARKLAESDRRPVLSLALTVNHPMRLLLEIEAKRRIMESHPLVSAKDVWGTDIAGLACEVCDVEPDLVLGGVEYARSDGCATLRALAAVYADHPDYLAEWKP